MKKIFFLFAFVNIQMIHAQTWVVIPDSNFVAQLHIIVPSAIRHDSLDVSSPMVKGIEIVEVGSSGISDLTGIQYFSSCTKLDCSNNPLISLPSLPDSLKYLYCAFCPLKSLPKLPKTLIQLICYKDSLTTLPDLPDSLSLLYCYHNKLTNIPILPSTLRELNCSSNKIDSLPSLPLHLRYLICANNTLTMLPALPNSLLSLDCSYNSLSSIPPLSDSLEHLYCSFNYLTQLPKLNAALRSFFCAHNLLTKLPELSNSMTVFSCRANYLTELPALPDHLASFWCDSNQIKCFPVFPNTLKTSYYFVIAPNPFNCVPNYVKAMGKDTLIYPLCKPGNSNGCLVIDGIQDINFKNSHISVFPNPTSSCFTIKSTLSGKVTVDLYNALGIQVFSENINDRMVIDVSSVENGIYTLRIMQGQNITNQRVVVAK